MGRALLLLTVFLALHVVVLGYTCGIYRNNNNCLACVKEHVSMFGKEQQCMFIPHKEDHTRGTCTKFKPSNLRKHFPGAFGEASNENLQNLKEVEKIRTSNKLVLVLPLEFENEHCLGNIRCKNHDNDCQSCMGLQPEKSFEGCVFVPHPNDPSTGRCYERSEICMEQLQGTQTPFVKEAHEEELQCLPKNKLANVNDVVGSFGVEFQQQPHEDERWPDCH